MTRFMTIRWGELVLDDVQVSTARQRGLVTQLPARGRGGFVQDRGPELRDCRVTVQWTKRSNDDDPQARYRKLLALDDGKTRLFVHPIDGAFPAKMSIEDESIQQRQIDVVVRFVEDRGSVGSNSAGITVHAAVEAAQKRADDAGRTLAAAGLPTDVAEQSAALATGWLESTPVADDVHTGLSRQTAAIGEAIRTQQLEYKPGKLDAYLSLLALSAALTDAASVVTAASPSLVRLEIGAPGTLLALAASLYGGKVAARRAEEIMRLNSLRSSNVIAAGTTLMVPSV